MSSPMVSVIVVTYNNKKWLERSIPSILKQSHRRLELIVVDNASLDRAGEWVQDNFPQVKVVYLSENKGFGAGCNAGVKHAKGEYVVFANEDMVFDKDFVKSLVEEMEKDIQIGACQGTIYKVQNSKFKIQGSKNRQFPVQSTGLFFNYTGILEGKEEYEPAGEPKVREIFSAVVPFMVRRDFFEAIEEFDGDFFLYFEEVDLCWRVWLTGRHVVHVAKAFAYHKGGVSTGKLSAAMVLEHSLRNRIQSYIKNLGFWRLIIALLVQLLILVLAGFIYLVNSKFGLWWAVNKAWMWNIYHSRYTIAKRLRIQRSRVMEDRELIGRVGGSLPVEKLLFLSGMRR